jgi:hypothetical protein
MVKFCETRFAQSKLMVHKNLEKNYKTNRTTRLGEAISIVPELDAVATSFDVVAAAAAKAAAKATVVEVAASLAAAAAEATSLVAAKVTAAAAAAEQQRLLQQQRQQQRGLRPRQRTTPSAETIVGESSKRRERAVAMSEGYREAAARIAARAVAL